MPVFGSRMVCETANYKYIEERDKVFADREDKLGRWQQEKNVRRAALNDLKDKIRKVSRSKSRSGSVTSHERISEEGAPPDTPPIQYRETGAIAGDVGGVTNVGISIISSPKRGYTRLEEEEESVTKESKDLAEVDQSSGGLCGPCVIL